MSKLTWCITCMSERELLDLEVPLSDKDRQIMQLREIVAKEIPDFCNLEREVSFRITIARHRCWHFLKPIQCIEVSATHITDHNDFEVMVNLYTLIVCPVCKKQHGRLIRTGNIVSKFNGMISEKEP